MIERLPTLSVVIPVFNEASILISALNELVGEMDRRKLNFEIIVAENGSTDATPQLLVELARSDPRIRWFHHPSPNYGAALKRGILAAKGQWVICDEIDLCDVSFYDQSLPILENGLIDMVIGSKAAVGASDHRPLIRRIATRAHNQLLRIALRFKGTDTHGLKAFARNAVLPVVNACVVDRDVFASELVIRSWRAGLSILEIPVQLREKRLPSIHLFRRVPNVLKNVAKLVYVVRIRKGGLL